MAVTAHYIDEYGTLCDHLIAFRKIDGHHSGENVGQALFDVLQESNIVDKVGSITLDNASNNNTLMRELASVMGTYGVEFDAEKNRIRCFPHVMNLAVSAILDSLPETAAAFRAEMHMAALPIDDETEQYLEALESQPVNLCRTSVTACRASGMRREGLRHTIVEGNRLGRFRSPTGLVYLVPLLQLIRDMPTRWSSTYNMIKRYIDLYPAITEYAFRIRQDVRLPVISHKQYEALQDILSILVVAHNAQELLSAEKTPTLALAFPVYEAVIETWEQLCATIPELAHSITCGILKLREYIGRTQEAPVHSLAMVVNPALKLEWIRQNWPPALADQAEAVVRSEMMRFQRTLSTGPEAHPTHSASGHASQAQVHGYMRVLAAGANLHRASDIRGGGAHESISAGDGPSHATNLVCTPHRSIPVRIPSSADLHARNQAVVEEELTRYIASGVVSTEHMGSIELVGFWKSHQYTYPLLYRIAMDVLPIQASSVSSERVFSSSKMTSTSERNRITPENMEYLQVLKHALIRRRREPNSDLVLNPLDFVSHVFENMVLEDD